MSRQIFLSLLILVLFTRDVSGQTAVRSAADAKLQLKEGLESLKQYINESRLMFEQSVRQALREELQSFWGSCASDYYTVLDNISRSVDHGVGNMCDRNLAVGWYRFLLNGADAVIPTTCVAKEHCGTHAPFWLDLQGGVMPAVGREIAARACANYSNNCCKWESHVTVRNCGSFVVYKLTPHKLCNLAYCAQRRSN